MTDIWDKLCEEFDKALFMQEYLLPKSMKHKWNQVKVEGDKLKEKAEAWDNYLEAIKDTVPHVSLDDYEILEDKLEAAKRWHKAQLGRQVDPTDIKELGEILEVEAR